MNIISVPPSAAFNAKFVVGLSGTVPQKDGHHQINFM
jgi:hypothetical protein